MAAFLTAAGALSGAGSAMAADKDIVSGDVRATAHLKNAVSCDDAGLTGTAYGQWNNDLAAPDGVVVFTRGAKDGEYLDVTGVAAGYALNGVVVKGSDGYNLYTASGSNLHAPMTGQENQNISGISHWFACVSVAPVELPPGDGEVGGEGDETPGDDTPGDDTPGDDTPGDETPGDDTPGDETPGDDTPGDETPTDDGEVEGTGDPVDETPTEDTPGDTSGETEDPADDPVVVVSDENTTTSVSSDVEVSETPIQTHSELPHTGAGAATPWLAATALGLVVSGAAITVAARRRRGTQG